MTPLRSWRLVVVFLALAALPSGALAQERDNPEKRYIEAHYTKQEYRIPMRDGARLYTLVYAPKDASRRYPLLLNRTPYGVAPYDKDEYRSSLGPSRLFPKEGYIFAY